ncbi:siphovirus Gp157 family protein [Chamaesiphon minutus]|uniref:Siphovirus Gp157 protein n=1 Tax=Chamaesiphon minutus (strain ATCC 27169 / PCC 6605) TaxID=1173020 RepID=K9UQM1_CHAP6|nr:siphovirus Gp157 family protein [Chamaesiphon minutus]AFY97100.1 siphovirus Gp157 protein [Chamaesiphon minutus PCC 6605]
MTSLLDLELSRDDLVEQIMAFIEEEEVEGKTDPIALINSFDELEAQIATKVDAIAAVVAAKEGEIAYLRKRRDNFNSQIEVRENALSNFKTYLEKILENRADSTIKGREATIKLVKNGGKQPLWTNENIPAKDFPANLVTVQTSYKVCTETIRKQLAESGAKELVINGEVLAQLQPRGTHLRIG